MSKLEQSIDPEKQEARKKKIKKKSTDLKETEVLTNGVNEGKTKEKQFKKPKDVSKVNESSNLKVNARQVPELKRPKETLAKVQEKREEKLNKFKELKAKRLHNANKAKSEERELNKTKEATKKEVINKQMKRNEKIVNKQIEIENVTKDAKPMAGIEEITTIEHEKKLDQVEKGNKLGESKKSRKRKHRGTKRRKSAPNSINLNGEDVVLDEDAIKKDERLTDLSSSELINEGSSHVVAKKNIELERRHADKKVSAKNECIQCRKIGHNSSECPEAPTKQQIVSMS